MAFSRVDSLSSSKIVRAISNSCFHFENNCHSAIFWLERSQFFGQLLLIDTCLTRISVKINPEIECTISTTWLKWSSILRAFDRRCPCI